MGNYNVIVAGGRTFDDYELMDTKLHAFLKGHNASEVTIVSGTANGADKMGERFAEKYGCHVRRMPANWNTYGKGAGYRRNVDMANIADACIVFWDGASKGTQHMINIANERELRLEVVFYG